MRQRILISLIALTTFLTCWTWYENSFRIDFFATKNRHLANWKRSELMMEQNIDSIRVKAIEILDNFAQRHSEEKQTNAKIANLLTVAISSTVLTLILCLFEFRKKARQ